MGVDEAGRGPVLGPLVVAAVDMDPSLLEGRGIKDSKLMTRNARADAFQFLILNSDHSILEIPARSIDELRDSISMNEIEVMAFSMVISSLMTGKSSAVGEIRFDHHLELRRKGTCSETAILDAADVDAERFGIRISEMIAETTGKGIDVISEHKADLNYPVVGAASVLAKVTRDRRIEEISSKAGCDIGSGYPSDPRTKGFLAEYVLRTGELPNFARASWETSKKLMKIRGQSRIFDF